MLIEIDVESGPNCDWPLMRIFEAQEEPREVSRVVAMLRDGSDGLCQVTGWSDDGPCPAYASRVADSGEGVVLLVYGGHGGIRLKPADSNEPWDVTDSRQWGEPCLLLAPDARAE